MSAPAAAAASAPPPTPPRPTLTTLPRDVQRRVYDRVGLAGLSASARVSRAWLRSVRDNSLLLSLQQVRLWPAASLRRLAVHLTWQSIAAQAPAPQAHQAPSYLPAQTGAAVPLLVLDGLAAWIAHDNEHEAGLQLLQHVRQLVSVGGDGNLEWSTPATLPQREWLYGVSVLPTSSVLRFSAPARNAPRQTHVRIAFSLSHAPDYRFFLNMDFERTQRRCFLAVMCRKRHAADQQAMDVLFNSDAAGLSIMNGAPVGYDPSTGMYVVRSSATSTTATVGTLAEQIVDRAFLNGLYMLASFIYAPAAEQLQQQIDGLDRVVV